MARIPTSALAQFIVEVFTLILGVCVIAWLIVGGVAVAGRFAPDPAPRPRVLLPCRVLRVKDADTIVVDVVIPFHNIVLAKQVVRLSGFDAPEVSRRRQGVTITDEEIAQGKQAAKHLESLLATAEATYLQPSQTDLDPRDRLEAYLIIWDGKSEIAVDKWMRDRGYTRPTRDK